jgi:hypothetical protein
VHALGSPEPDRTHAAVRPVEEQLLGGRIEDDLEVAPAQLRSKQCAAGILAPPLADVELVGAIALSVKRVEIPGPLEALLVARAKERSGERVVADNLDQADRTAGAVEVLVALGIVLKVPVDAVDLLWFPARAAGRWLVPPLSRTTTVPPERSARIRAAAHPPEPPPTTR